MLSVVVSIALSSYASCSYASDDIQFNTDVLDVKDRSNINLSQFSKAGYVMPGLYQFAVKVNGQQLADERNIIYLVKPGDANDSIACLSPDVVKDFGLKETYFNKLRWINDGKCLDITSLDGMSVKGNMATSTLEVGIPQAYLEYVSDNWDPPSRWDNGIAGLLFDYNVNAQANFDNNDYNGGRNYNLGGNGTTGFNLGAWRFRADWQGNLQHYTGTGEGTDTNFDWSRYYAYRPIPSLKAKLTLGEDYLSSDIFDSFRFLGGSLVSDDSMLPPNLRGYAPEVVGVANSNARVIVSQQGRILYQTQVAPGPFRIQDLSSAVSGRLDVRIEEQNGDVRTFQVSTSSIPYLTRPGTVRYKLALGKPQGYNYNDNVNTDDNSDDYGDNYTDLHSTKDAQTFASGEFSWGVNSGWSLYGGAIGSSDYNALSAGIGRDLLSFGALAFDVTNSWANLPEYSDKLSGSSYRLSYSKNFDEYDSQVTFAAYRFSQRDFMTMNEFLNARQNNGVFNENSKQMYTVTMNKQFADLGMSIYLNYSRETYWDSEDTNRYNLTASRYFDAFGVRNMSLSLTAYKNQYKGSDDNGAYLSFSMPIGERDTLSVNSSINNGDFSNEASYYRRLDDNNNYQLSAGHVGEDITTRANYNHLGDMAEVNTNLNYQANQSTSFGLTLRGGATATRKGVALHRTNTMGGTRLLVDTDDTAGVPVQGYGAVTHTNAFGYAVISDINSYYRDKASVDLTNLADDVEVTDSVVQATLTEGAIGYRKFKVISGKKAMAAIRLPDGTSPPFGATVTNASKQETGIVNDNGNVYLSGIKPGGKMLVKWNGDQQCEISMPNKLPNFAQSNLLLPCVKS
ncbi:outer membrane usher protein [Serratia proteamaculans]|nr:outer membrane usher protein [Serratia proteamaculans]